MRLRFWGAAGEVTGSAHLLEVNGRWLLLDAGLNQGRRKAAFEINRALPCPADSVDAIILSHAHIDHCGNLPTWVRRGYRRRVYATSATRDLAGLMLMDSARIQAGDLKYVNRQRLAENKRLFEPLYIEDDVLETWKQFVSIEYGVPFEPIPGVTARFLDAGHMLGSAMVVLDVEEGSQRRRLVFSGDLGHCGSPLLREPAVPEAVDLLIMESTYGNRLHPARDEAAKMLRATMDEVVQSKGKLLIPAFAVGRTQELVFHLDQMCERGELPPIPVFVDSPLAANVTEVFRLHPEAFSETVLAGMKVLSDGNPFGFERLTYVREAEQSKRLNELTGPAVIISASGMCEAGRILHHLKNNVADPRTIILFVGYQAGETLGRKLLDGRNPVSILGTEHTVRAQIRQSGSFSGHADRDELLAWVAAIRQTSKLADVFLVHGEDAPRNALAQALEKSGLKAVHRPTRGQVFDRPAD